MPHYNPLDYCRPAVVGVEPYHPGKSAADLAREHRVGEMVKLSSNENVLGPPAGAIAAIRDCAHELMRYPDGGGRLLCQEIAQWHGVSPACVTLGNGSNELLELVGRCFLEPGKGAVYSEHAFAVYQLTAQICGADHHVTPALAANSIMPYGHDLSEMVAAVDIDTRVIFIANPNNPTGTWFDGDALEALLCQVPSSAVVVIDEAYAEYVTEPKYPAAAEWLTRFPNLVVTRTFSKVFGLAGLRIGYALSSPEVAELLNRVRQPFNASLPAQRGALAALADAEHIEKSIALNNAGLEQLQKGCELLQITWIPSVANFLCIKVGEGAAAIGERLITEGVIVRPLDNYGLPHHLRVTVGRSADNRRVLEALKRVLGR